MLHRILILSVVCTFLLCCGCRSEVLSAKETQAISEFVQKQTGEPVIAATRGTDGNVGVITKMPGGGSRHHLWLLKRTRGEWKLVEQGISTL